MQGEQPLRQGLKNRIAAGLSGKHEDDRPQELLDRIRARVLALDVQIAIEIGLRPLTR